ncbi:golvesin C-terminal-like domain-containing protein [Lentzea sp. NPDC055074]
MLNKRTTAFALCVAMVGSLLSALQASAAAPPQPPPATELAADKSTVDPKRRDAVLSPGWSTSQDLAWTTSGDSTGLHLLVAEAATGYTWRTAATLGESWIDSDQWIGNACVTGSGKRAVVVYAPRHFTNRAHLFDRGAFAAVVDLTNGHVTKLGTTVSLAYYNPGCGTGETAVLTQSGVVDFGVTRLNTVDTTTGAVVRAQEFKGEVTSAIPFGDGIAAARGSRVVAIDAGGGTRDLAPASGVPFRLRADAEGGVVFMDRDGDDGRVRRVSGGKIAELARGDWAALRVTGGVGGEVFVTGKPEKVGALPASVRRIDVEADAEVSTLGGIAFGHRVPRPGDRTNPDEGMRLAARVPATGHDVEFRVHPAARQSADVAQGLADSPAVTMTGRAAADPSKDPVDHDRRCSIQRNDVNLQVYQPHWSQVEWAAELAVQNRLTTTRPANWKNSGMTSSWSPQVMFKPYDLVGGGRVPAQIMLGVLAQESNLWQASSLVTEGVTGNPLIGSYYGAEDGWTINWATADCGYGVAQVTDGMRKAGTPGAGTTLPADQQLAVAVDYATNIAAGVRILQDKWNQTRSMGITLNGGDPSKIENWFAALWAYNSGINPQASTGNTTGCTPGPSCTDAAGNWGLGWSNNPARTDYPPDRAPFLDHDSYEDAKNPQWWPYPEKVIGWAAFPIVKYTGGDGYEAGYKQAWWTTAELRTGAKPPLSTFCVLSATTGNRCNPTNPTNLQTSAEPCTSADFHCWWHSAAQWKNCTGSSTPCGNAADVIAAPGTPEPPDADVPGAYTDESRPRRSPNCTTAGLPANALIVDDAPTAPLLRAGCQRPWTNSGSFELSFPAHTDGLYHSKVDFHQLGAGFGGHFWFTRTRPSSSISRNQYVSGTWTLGRALNQWARVMVHVPDHQAHSQQAKYTINLGNGQARTRAILQKTRSNKWVSLGAFQFGGTPTVSLSSITRDGDGSQALAFDAVAFQPLSGKPAEQMVVMGDSYTSGEGASTNALTDYYQETDDAGYTGPAYRNACHRSVHSWSRQVKLPGRTLSVGQQADSWDQTLDYHSTACSGARTDNVLPSATANAWGRAGTGSYRELSQLDRGFVDADTTTVAVGIGGNDAHFTDVLRKCSIESPHPLDDCQHMQMAGEDWVGGGAPVAVTLGSAVRQVIKERVKPSVDTLLREIRVAAPNARIVVMGYPRLFPPGGPRDPGCAVFPGLSSFDMTFMNNMADLLNDALHELVTLMVHGDRRILFSDPRDEFELENACTHNPDHQTIHQVVVDKTLGEDPNATVSAQSFHPKISGARNYADAFEHTQLVNTAGAKMPAPPGKAVALAVLDDLRTYPAGSPTGYDRTLFPHWRKAVDACDGREVSLRRDATTVTPAGSCPVLSGSWTSAYDGMVLTDPSKVAIDHVVPLADAWRSGASSWTHERKIVFANDVEHSQLLAVSGTSNTAKLDRPPDVWLPRTSYLCEYARAWTYTKSIYHLNVTDAEYQTLAEILETRC